jgi:hypothetical protein
MTFTVLAHFRCGNTARHARYPVAKLRPECKPLLRWGANGIAVTPSANLLGSLAGNLPLADIGAGFWETDQGYLAGVCRV